MQQLPSSELEGPLRNDASTAELLREALDEAKELARIEVELARADVKHEIVRSKRAAIGFAVAIVAALMVICLLGYALVMAFGGTALVALVVAGCFLAAAGIAALIGYTLLPKKPLEATRSRLQLDVNHLKEHIA
ncbi:hypothetical protein AKJ09_01319 [Labilithrix luteola]|uniref:Integral membrane protein n=1 Tax=Labilithrix luteola TaxID=1391654 RepID=A0A0K1PM99_9BACT|nr:phage holin family protein [Labilithrix luteola]AKU94655.1 hypothetical protein AKJ09_01319 [Labilithrix luteola]